MTEQRQLEEAGFEALQRLYEFALRDHGQCRIVASFLLGLYNGSRFPFDLTDLRGLDGNVFDDCMAVLRMDARVTAREVHTYFADGGRKFESLAKLWGVSDMERVWSAAQAVSQSDGAMLALHEGGEFEARLVSYGDAPGYRDVSLVVTLGEHQNTRVRLGLSASASVDLMLHIAHVHATAWRSPEGPIDRGIEEPRPQWLDLSPALYTA